MKRYHYVVVLLLLLCLFTAYAAADMTGADPYPTPKPQVNGSVYVASFPTGAAIRLDGVLRGTTNTLIPNITPGSHNLTLSKAGYQNQTLQFDVKAGEQKVLPPVTLTQSVGPDGEKGSLYVSSVPTNATISLDGTNKGLTNLWIMNIAPGNHTLVLTKTGYQKYTEKVEVKAGEEKILPPITLTPSVGPDGEKASIYVSSIPTNATIFLDGVKKGTTDSWLRNVTAGTHSIRLNKTGYQNETLQVEVKAGEEKILSPIMLTPGAGPDGEKASIYVSSTPTNATITLDGVNKGVTNTWIRNVSAGNHTLALAKTGYQRYTEKVEVKAGEEKVLPPITLTPSVGPDGEKGSLYVSSVPTNATITLDGVNKGLTNRWVMDIAPGNHTLVLTKTGYQKYTEKVEVKAGEEKVLSPITLTPSVGPDGGKASIYVSSVPTNASIFLDGIKKGSTDGWITNITAGTHNLTLNKTGYQNFTEQVEVMAGEEKVLLPITLTPSAGPDGEKASIYVSSVPTNATITLDGVNKGLTNRWITNVSAGNHTLVLTKTGYQKYTETVGVKAGEEKILPPITLTPSVGPDGEKGSLYVSSVPTNATITLDGVNKGLTNRWVTNIAPGNHTLVLTKTGYQKHTQQVEVKAGEEKVLPPVTLTPSVGPDGGKASIYVSSVPTNASIFLDGIRKGSTDQWITNITAGSHNLTLNKTGYQNQTVQVTVEAGEEKILPPITLTPSVGPDGEKGSLYISSVPTNATISLDGVNKGLTNRWVTNIAPGNHTLVLTKTGYQKHSQQVEVKAGEEKVLPPVMLNSSVGPDGGKGSLYVSSIPSNATIYLDGINKGSTNKLITGISPGSHNLTLTKTGFEGTTIWVDIVAGASKILPPIPLSHL